MLIDSRTQRVKPESMISHHYKSFSLLVLFLGFSVNADDYSLINSFNSVTSNCHNKTVEKLINQVETLEEDLYQHAQNLENEHQDILFKLKGDNQLLSIYILFGVPYIPEKYLSGKLATTCYTYYKDFKDSFKTAKVPEAKESMLTWKACVWDMYRVNQPLADQFQSCIQSIPLVENNRTKK